MQPLASVSVNEQITLYIGTHYIRLLRKWHRYPALNGFQKAKTIQCCTRQIVSNLGQRKLEQLESLRSMDTPAASWLPIPLGHIGSQVKRRQSQSYKFKTFAKITIFLILKRALFATYLLKLLDKMCKYELDPMSIVENTERTQFCPQTDRRTRWYQYTPFQLRWSRGYNKYPTKRGHCELNCSRPNRFF